LKFFHAFERGYTYHLVMHRTTVRNILVAAASTAILIVALVAPETLINQRAPVVDAVAQTSIALTGTLIAFLMLGRYRRFLDIRDLQILFAVLLLAWVHTLFKVVPDLISPMSVGNGVSERIEIWGASVTKILAAWYVLHSTALGEPSLDGSLEVTVVRQRYRTLYAPALLGVVVLALLVWLAPVSHGGFAHDVPLAQAPSVLVEFVGALLFFAAGWRLTQESTRLDDPFLSWIAIGCMFGGFSMISSGLFGAQDGEWLQPSDIFRLALVYSWAWGAVIEIRHYWSTISESSRRKARRSVALDLHDGTAQDLSLITSYLYAPADERGSDEWHRQIQTTAERALAEVRRTITTLSSDPDEASNLSLRRNGVYVDVLSPSAAGLDDPRSRESIVFIVREAVTNALRHGRAESIRVQLSNENNATVLRVVDNGVGFDANHAFESGHFGMVSMKEKATSVGASLFVHSLPGAGTTVEILWP
jgi:signal transduction histidine kinase